MISELNKAMKTIKQEPVRVPFALELHGGPFDGLSSRNSLLCHKALAEVLPGKEREFAETFGDIFAFKSREGECSQGLYLFIAYDESKNSARYRFEPSQKFFE